MQQYYLFPYPPLPKLPIQRPVNPKIPGKDGPTPLFGLLFKKNSKLQIQLSALSPLNARICNLRSSHKSNMTHHMREKVLLTSYVCYCVDGGTGGGLRVL
jgi:hypothetical protein